MIVQFAEKHERKISRVKVVLIIPFDLFGFTGKYVGVEYLHKKLHNYKARHDFVSFVLIFFQVTEEVSLAFSKLVFTCVRAFYFFIASGTKFLSDR